MSAIGLWFGVQPYPQSNALYEVSVRQARYLPPASSRFHLAMDTLAIGYAIPAIRAHSGLSPVRHCSCQAYTPSFISASQRRSLYRSADIETSEHKHHDQSGKSRPISNDIGSSDRINYNPDANRNSYGEVDDERAMIQRHLSI